MQLENPSRDELLSSIDRQLVESLAEQDDEKASLLEAAYPLNGGERAYRGWYPIFGSGKSRWCPRQSRHGGPRPDAPHVGADLWSGQATKIVAARDGTIEYNPRNDPNGWGNHIYLYFKQAGTVWIAVYAHLDASSAFPGKRVVNAGQEIGVPGCSGNAGDNGNCYRQYKCSGRTAISDHLHFEVMDARTAVRSDPVAFFGFAVRHATDNICAECGSNEQLS